MLTKLFLLTVCTLFFTSSFSQKKIEHYYNYYWRESPPDDARFYSLEVKTYSGWYKTDYYISTKKLQMVGLYEDQDDVIRNGTFYWFYSNGVLASTGKYKHGKKTGL